MNLRKYIFLIIFLFFIPIKSYPEKLKILYVVEDNLITNIDIKNEINYLLLINNELSKISPELLVEYSTKSLLREKIKEIELKKRINIDSYDDVVQINVDRFKKRLNLTNENSYEELLNSLNLNKNYIFNKIKIETLWNKYIFERFKNTISVNKDQIKRELEEKINTTSNEVEEFLLHEIIFNANTKEKLQNEYIKIINSISEIGFENTASVLSNASSSKYGGEIGWVNISQLSRKIIKEVATLKIGEISKPIDIGNGKMILFLKDKRQVSKKISFEEEYEKAVILDGEQQLDKLSEIYFKKIELDTKIYEK
mgnify:CR=1 FL=1